MSHQEYWPTWLFCSHEFEERIEIVKIFIPRVNIAALPWRASLKHRRAITKRWEFVAITTVVFSVISVFSVVNLFLALP